MRKVLGPSRAVLAAIVGAGALAGCSTMPGRKAEAPPLPAQWREELAAPGAVSVVDWWKGFNDPLLDALIAEGLAASPDVRQAILRVRQARAEGRQTLAGYLPIVSPEASASTTEVLDGPRLFTADRAGAESRQGTGSYGASVSWEIPLFARAQAATIGARANTRSAEADVRGAKVTLAGDVAEAYVALRQSQQRRAALLESVRIGDELAAILQRGVEVGYTSPADAADAVRQAESNRAQLADAEINLRSAVNQLATLRGRAPGTEPAELAQRLETVAGVPTITLAAAPAAPANLLRMRPDIAAAEADAVVAAAQLGLARADLLPQISLTGSLLRTENLIGAALSGGTTQLTLNPAISVPLLDWGRGLAAVRSNDAQFESALIDYENTVTQAVSEASNALIGWVQGDGRLRARRAAEAAAETTTNAQRASFGAGLSSLYDRLRTEQDLLEARLSRIDAEASAANAAIAVYRAFGGGPPDAVQPLPPS